MGDQKMSNLPSFETMREELFAETHMSIQRKTAAVHEGKFVTTNIWTRKDGKREQVKCTLMTVDVSDIGGLIPSKVWIANGYVNMTYYVHPSLPSAARRFDSGKMHIIALGDLGEECEVLYPLRASLFIDQLIGYEHGEATMRYVFLFDDCDYATMIDASQTDQ